MHYSDLNGKVVLITGGGTGIGAETARAFLEQGSRLALVDISSTSLAATAASLGAPADRLITITADVSSEDDVRAYVEKTLSAYGTIDVFFNNAGIEGKIAPLVDQDMADVDRVFAINIRGVYLGLKYVLPIMYARKSGSVINTSSTVGLSVGSGQGVSPYVASKFAITGLTRLVANEAAPYGVRVNSLHPSAVNTEMMSRLVDTFAPGKSAETIASMAGIPMKRYAEPREIANVVLFLAANASSFVTGAQYCVDGGQLA